MGDYDLDTNMNTMNEQFCNGKDHQDFQEFVYVIGWDWLVTFS